MKKKYNNMIIQETSHRKKVDQRVTATDAKAYDHSIITEHSLALPPNNWDIVPAKIHSNYTRDYN